jgi:molybdate transport system ATP-binding protein
MTLAAHVVRKLTAGDRGGRDPFELDVTIEGGDREIVAVLGPNGAGKSTLLRCLAGLLALDSGHVTLAGAVLDDPERDVFVPAERRPIGVVFQDYLLFAHLSALENVAFGLRARGARRRDARRRASALLERVGLAEYAGARPGALSGGQQQRVALARALAGDPQLLLLDEPLAALDVSTRADVRRELRRQLAGFDGTRIVVTHDPLDAYALADRVVIIEGGCITHDGSLVDVTAHPRTQYVAELVGTNLLTGSTDGREFSADAGGTLVTSSEVTGRAFVTIAPSAIALYRTPPDGSPRNVWRATVADVDRRLDRVRVRLDGALPVVAEVTVDALAALNLRPGDDVWAVVKATEIETYPS